MVSQLDVFYKFYQECETEQCIDLSKTKNQYLVPSDHPAAEKIYQAAQVFNKDKSTKVTHFVDDLYTINEAPDWVIRSKAEAYSFIQDAPMGPGSSKTLRVVMNHRLKKIVAEQKLDIIIPDEYLVEDSGTAKKSVDKISYKNFRVISQKLDIYDYQNTIKEIRLLNSEKQKEIATTICRLIYHSGFMDSHMGNFALTKDKNIAVVDTEGHSLIHDVSETEYSHVSLATARVVGLKEFISRSKEAYLPDVFEQTAQKYLFFARMMNLVRIATIFFSVICPLLPIVVLICSIVTAKLRNSANVQPQLTQHSLALQRGLVPV